MDNKNLLIFFIVMVILLVFTFAFAWVSLDMVNTAAGIMAVVGFAAALSVSLILGISNREEGGALAIAYFVYALVTGILLVWYLTRIGSLWQLW